MALSSQCVEDQRTLPEEDVEQQAELPGCEESRVAMPSGHCGKHLCWAFSPSEYFVFFITLQLMPPWCLGELLEGLCMGLEAPEQCCKQEGGIGRAGRN